MSELPLYTRSCLSVLGAIRAEEGRRLLERLMDGECLRMREILMSENERERAGQCVSVPGARRGTSGRPLQMAPRCALVCAEGGGRGASRVPAVARRAPRF